VEIAPEYLVACAGVIYVCAFLIINQIFLRITLLVGSVFYVWYYFIVADVPLWAAIFSNFAIFLANSTGLAMLLLRGSKLIIPQQYRDIYPLFSVLQPGDFRTLMRLSKRYVADSEIEMTAEDAPVRKLYFVVEGKVEACKRGQSFSLSDGIFVGEIGYLTSNAASATTKLAAGSDVLEWDVDTLRRKAKRSPRFNLALDAAISKDLATKVSRAGAPIANVGQIV
jgi:CRP-like cAMP-binding protein